MTRQVIDRGIRGYGFQPTSNGAAGSQYGEMFIGPQEYFLRQVLRLRLVAGQTHDGGIDHVLICLHKACEFVSLMWIRG
jgi:hypothetical protein